MMYRRAFAAGLALFLLFFAIDAQSAQKAEVTVSLNEAFFDALLDSVFTNLAPPEFSIAQVAVNHGDTETQSKNSNAAGAPGFNFANYLAARRPGDQPAPCAESIKILREMNGVRTAVRFRDGKIYVP